MALFLQTPQIRSLYQHIPPLLNGLDPFALTDIELVALKESSIDFQIEIDIRKWSKRRSNIRWDKIMQESANSNIDSPKAADIERQRHKETRMLEIIQIVYLEHVLDVLPYFWDTEITLAADEILHYTATPTEEKSRYEAIHREIEKRCDRYVTRSRHGRNGQRVSTSITERMFPKGWWICHKCGNLNQRNKIECKANPPNPGCGHQICDKDWASWEFSYSHCP